MLYRNGELNKFQGRTWRIELDNLFKIVIEETNSKNYVVHFKEWKWVSSKTHFSYISNDNFKDTVINSFVKVGDFFKRNPHQYWSYQKLDNALDKLLYIINDSKNKFD